MHSGLIKSIIAKHPALFEQASPVITQLPKGAWNFNYKVSVGDQSYVFKVYTHIEKYAFGGNDPLHEYKLLQLLKQYSIAPKPVLCVPQDNDQHFVLVYLYVEGERLIPSPAGVIQVAKILATLHSLPTTDALFLDTYDESLPGLHKEAVGQFEIYVKKTHVDGKVVVELKDYLRKTEELSQQILPYPQAIVHTDMVPSNFVRAPVRLIDWQRPAIGDPAFDCWAFTSDIFNWWDWGKMLSTEEKEIFWNTYLQHTEDIAIKERIRLKALFYYLRMLLYCLNRYADFKSGTIPPSIIQGREHIFEKYTTVIALCRENLKKLLV